MVEIVDQAGGLSYIWCHVSAILAFALPSEACWAVDYAELAWASASGQAGSLP